MKVLAWFICLAIFANLQVANSSPLHGQNSTFPDYEMPMSRKSRGCTRQFRAGRNNGEHTFTDINVFKGDLKELTICYNRFGITGIQERFTSGLGPCHGSCRGASKQVIPMHGVGIKQVTGTTGTIFDSLVIFLNNGKLFGPFGNPRGGRFFNSSPSVRGNCVMKFLSGGFTTRWRINHYQPIISFLEFHFDCCPHQTKECPDGWSYFHQTNRCYKLFTKSKITWMDAQSRCNEHGGNLAMNHDEATNTFINHLLGGSMAWIGAKRVGPLVDPKPRNDQWTWIDGSPLDYSNWVSGQPNNAGKIEYCGMINRWKSEGLWNDAPCNWPEITRYVCQL